MKRNRLTVPGIVIAFATFFVPGSPRVPGQSLPRPTPPSDPAQSSKAEKDDLGGDISSHENEMRAKLVLKDAKKQYDENVDRAREAAQIGSELRDAYEAKKSFSAEDKKKLERMEKLTRRIRNEAGGSDSDVEEEKTPLVETVVKRVAEVADDLRKQVEKTPRHVISATVIDQATKLLGLIHHLRDLNR